MISNKGKRIILNTLEKCTSLKTIDIILDGGKTDEEFKKECQRVVERSGQKNNSSPLLRISTTMESEDVVNKDDLVPKDVVDKDEDTGEAWKRVSEIILGEVVTYRQYYSTHYIRDLLQTLLKTVKDGCCSNVGPGYMCGHCEASINVIRISRTVILSIRKLPLKKIRDQDTNRDLKRIRSWVYNQIKEFKDDSGDEIEVVLPPKLSEIIFSKKIDIQPLWEEDDFGILLQQPSPSWIMRINMLMLMGYKVALVNFNDVARFSRKDLKVVHSDFFRLLCPAETGDDDASDSESGTKKESVLAGVNDKALFNQPPPADDELFVQPPPEKDCPICCFRLPTLGTGKKYTSCCGKVICSGCIYTSKRINGGLCPLCSTPVPTSDEEENILTKNRMETGDANAIFNIGVFYAQGKYGYPQDIDKALELWHQAADGYTPAYYNIGVAYGIGRGVEVDKKKANHYFKLAAMHGHAVARHNLGSTEALAGNFDRAVKHYTIAAKTGSERSLELMKRMHKNGHATKDDYTRVLRAYQAYLDEVKSDQRDEAAAYDEKKYKYY